MDLFPSSQSRPDKKMLHATGLPAQTGVRFFYLPMPISCANAAKNRGRMLELRSVALPVFSGASAVVVVEIESGVTLGMPIKPKPFSSGDGREAKWPPPGRTVLAAAQTFHVAAAISN